MPSLLGRMRGALGGWTQGDAPTIDAIPDRYAALYAFWSGDWQHAEPVTKQYLRDRRLYKNTRQLWRQASAVVALYTQFVYAGNSLSTNADPLPDGTRGAIPIEPQAGSDAQDEALRLAIAEWWSMTNYRQFMSMRPKFGAILGDCLTELVDDKRTGAVRPQLIWPGYVDHLELDLAGNVKGYSVSWRVDEPETHLYGTTQPAKSYVWRKDVSGDGFWYYHDDRLVSQEENPYGFVPAVWDRHEIVMGDRGMSAIERTFQQATEMNSILSHAMDYQQKQFGAPIGVKGSSLGNRNTVMKMLDARNSTGDPAHDAAMVAQSLGLLPMTDNGEFVTVNFDVGKTGDLLNLVMDSILAENPEARYSQQILDMTQVTAPGVERALGPIVGLVKDARKNYDTQTIKLIQMAVSMTAWRVVSGGYAPELLQRRAARYDVFRPFAPGAYDAGLMDFTIPDREVIPETIDERIARQMQIEQLQWEYSLRVAGVPDDVVAEIIGERDAERERMARLDEITAVGPPAEDVNDNEEPPA